ncbi:MAG: hypothetical protein QXS68_03120 [Candidatus Methanomethylicaceae archaeon]
MLDVVDEVVSILTSSASWNSLITGGTYSSDVLGRQGISYTNPVLSSSFSGSSIKPIAFVTVRNSLLTDEIRDEEAQAASVISIVEIHLYQDDGTSIIEDAEDIAFGLLHDRRTDTGIYMLSDIVGPRYAEELAGAFHLVLRYKHFSIKRPV